MILSRKKLYKIKKTKEQSRRRRKHRNKKKYRKEKEEKVEEERRALNLRKRTMKVYRGGVNRHVLSFVFPNDSNQLVLVSFNPSNTGNSSQNFKQSNYGKSFYKCPCRIQEIVHLEHGEDDNSWKSSRIRDDG